MRKGVAEKAKAAPRELARRGLDDGTERLCGQLRNDRGQEQPQDYGGEKIEGGAQRGAALAGRSVEAFLKSRKKEQERRAERFAEKDIGVESVDYAAQESAERPVLSQSNANAQPTHTADIQASPLYDASAAPPASPTPEKPVAMNVPADTVQPIGREDDLSPVHENRRYSDVQGTIAETPTIKEKVSDPRSNRIEENIGRTTKTKEQPVSSVVSGTDYPRISSEQRRRLVQEKAELPGHKLPLAKDSLAESSSGGFSPKIKERPQDIHRGDLVETISTRAETDDVPVIKERTSKTPATREIPRGLETQGHEKRQSSILRKAVPEPKVKERVGSAVETADAPSRPAASHRQVPIRVREQVIREREKDAQITQRPTALRQEPVSTNMEGRVKEVFRPTIQPRPLTSSEDTQLVRRYSAKIPNPTGYEAMPMADGQRNEPRVRIPREITSFPQKNEAE